MKEVKVEVKPNKIKSKPVVKEEVKKEPKAKKAEKKEKPEKTDKK